MEFIAAIASYVIGSIPFAFLAVKLFAKKDVTVDGSGNVGAMNSYEITNKKWIGIAVFALDALKGVAAVVFAAIVAPGDTFILGLCSIFAVVGHNWSIFLKFKGGRGLSTSLGVFVLILPVFIPIWGVLWALGFYIAKRNIHIGNVVATVITPISFFVFPKSLASYVFFESFAGAAFEFNIIAAVICFFILLRHVKPIVELVAKR